MGEKSEWGAGYFCQAVDENAWPCQSQEMHSLIPNNKQLFPAPFPITCFFESSFVVPLLLPSLVLCF